jgi:uncharacterized protein YggL (DUF469 family)
MVLQSSGAISLNDIQTEFGGTNPIGINEYYDAADGVPASGEISFDDFYGKSNYILTSAYQSQLATWGFTPDNLVYKSSSDGLTNSAFHNNCDSLDRSIVVIKAANGYIFGGIATNSWSGGGYRSSTTAFVFNLYGNASAPIKWNITIPTYAMYVASTYGPTFGAGHDIHTNLDNNYMYASAHSYGNGGGYTGRVTGYTNTGYNRIVEVEVWSIAPLLTSAYQSQLATWGFIPDSLVYKSSRDGLTNSAFHNNCDSLDRSIVVIKAVNGYTFGGIATNSWSGGGYRSSTTAFVFNLYGNASAPIKWDITNSSYNMYVASNYGPTFGGGHDLHTNLDSNYMYANAHSYGGGGGYTGRVTGYTNAGYNRIVEVEVWSILLLTPTYQSQLATWGFTPDSLVYKSGRDGLTNSAFHNKCDSLSRSIVVVRAANGYIFGGIATNSWSGSGYKSSTTAFVFNLYGNASAPIKWDITNTSYNIYVASSYGPTFGGGFDLHTNLDSNYMYASAHSYGGGGGYTGRMTGYTNPGNGRIVDIEVWSY